MSGPPQPWTAAMEATMFPGWIYDHLVRHAPVKVAHPLMLRAIAAAKKKNDRIDASKIADCLRLRCSRKMTQQCSFEMTRAKNRISAEGALSSTPQACAVVC